MVDADEVFTDGELRANHDFVMAFETLRRRHGHREMSDAALHDVATATGVPYEQLRITRHLRNALAHGDRVNRDALRRSAAQLDAALGVPQVQPSSDSAVDGRALRVHAWLDAGLEEEMLANGFVSVGGVEIGDLTGVEDLSSIESELTTNMPDRSASAIKLFVGYWRRFLSAVPGDVCVLPTRRRDVAIGEFVGSYHYVADAEPRARHRRNVGWLALGVDRSRFGSDLTRTIEGRHTVQEFKAPQAYKRLRIIAETGVDPGPSPEPN